MSHRKCNAKHNNNPRISADWSTTKQIATFSCTPCVQEVHTKAEVVQLTPGLLGLGVLNPRISADWSMTKPIAAFSSTPSVQEVHTKAEDVQLIPGLLGLGVIFTCHA